MSKFFEGFLGILKALGLSGSGGLGSLLQLLSPLLAVVAYFLFRAQLQKKLSERLNSEFEQSTSEILAQGRKDIQTKPVVYAIGILVLIWVGAGQLS